MQFTSKLTPIEYMSTLIWLTMFHIHVLFKISFSWESLWTTFHCAWNSFACMDIHVAIKRLLRFKPFLKFGAVLGCTLKWFIVHVAIHVLVQLQFVCKLNLTNFTLKMLLILLMVILMHFVTGQHFKFFVTTFHGTNIFVLTPMSSH